MIVLVLYFLHWDSYELSVLNVDTNSKIVLGDTKKQIENLLGEPSKTSSFFGTKRYDYDNEKIHVVYDSNECAVAIYCTGDNYSTQKAFSVGDDISKVEKKFKKIYNKTIYLINGKPADRERVDEEIKNKGYENIKVISFGSNISDETIEYIMIGEYKTVLFGLVE
jgi:outer membrane protein assembly factor BamE (lipoprotein component of BamABCDE complex)